MWVGSVMAKTEGKRVPKKFLELSCPLALASGHRGRLSLNLFQVDEILNPSFSVTRATAQVLSSHRRLVSTVLGRGYTTLPSSQEVLLERAALENPDLRAGKPGHDGFAAEFLWQVTEPAEPG